MGRSLSLTKQTNEYIIRLSLPEPIFTDMVPRPAECSGNIASSLMACSWNVDFTEEPCVSTLKIVECGIDKIQAGNSAGHQASKLHYLQGGTGSFLRGCDDLHSFPVLHR